MSDVFEETLAVCIFMGKVADAARCCLSLFLHLPATPPVSSDVILLESVASLQAEFYNQLALSADCEFDSRESTLNVVLNNLTREPGLLGRRLEADLSSGREHPAPAVGHEGSLCPDSVCSPSKQKATELYSDGDCLCSRWLCAVREKKSTLRH